MPKIAIVYDSYSTLTNTVREHVSALGDMEEIETYFLRKDRLSRDAVEGLDGLILHYSCRLAFPESLGEDFLRVFEEFAGIKIFFIQDEYDNTEITRSMIERLSPSIVFTCVPSAHIDVVYPQARFPNTEFIQVLTGFAPSPDDFSAYQVPYSQRTIDIGYRGRKLGLQYGRLGQEKQLIGTNVLQDPNFMNLNLDISSSDTDRIYGNAWNRFLSNCKAVLGTDSGSNLFDFQGNLRQLALECRTFVEFESKLPDGVIEFDFMGQISPRIFEAAAAKTLNILYPGNYSGILTPWVHYIPLERDHSNALEILKILNNEQDARKICETAFEHLITSGEYSKESFSDIIQARIFPYLNVSNQWFVQHHSLEGRVHNQKDIRNSKLGRFYLLAIIWRVIPQSTFKKKILRMINQVYELLTIQRA